MSDTEITEQKPIERRDPLGDLSGTARQIGQHKRVSEGLKGLAERWEGEKKGKISQQPGAEPPEPASTG